VPFELKSNKDYWIPKIENNIEYDFTITQELPELDWAVIRFWDFEIRKDVKACADKIETAYRNRTTKEK